MASLYIFRNAMFALFSATLWRGSTKRCCPGHVSPRKKLPPTQRHTGYTRTNFGRTKRPSSVKRAVRGITPIQYSKPSFDAARHATTQTAGDRSGDRTDFRNRLYPAPSSVAQPTVTPQKLHPHFRHNFLRNRVVCSFATV